MQYFKLKTTEESQVYVFDLEHEQKRRQQLEKLFNRTKEQIDEELYLIEEMKKIEIRKREREKKQQDVNKLLTAVVDLENTNNRQQQVLGSSSGSIGGSSVLNSSQSNLLKHRAPSNDNSLNNTSNKRIKNRNRLLSNDQLNRSLTTQSTSTNLNNKNSASINNLNSSFNNNLSQSSANNSLNNSNDNLNSPSSSTSNSLINTSFDSKNKKTLIFKAVVESAGIKFTDNKVSGVSLRSHRMKLPQSVGLKKTKAIEQLLDELQIEQKPIATDTISDQFNELRSDMVLLYELHQALTNYDYELQTLRHRYESVLTSKVIKKTILYFISLK